jgi:Flp pilus assembly protein TadD
MSAVHQTRPAKPPVARRRQATSRETRAPKPHRLSAPPSGIWWRAGLIVAVGALAYSNSLSGPFVYDDQLSIVENRYIRQLSSLGRVLFPERELPVAGRPVVNVSFAINYAIGGLEVRGYHIWNVAIHILCALVLFGVVRRTLNLASLQSRFAERSTNLAFAAALIWMLHPLNTEAVDYLTQRTEAMMGLCYLATLYAAIRAAGAHRAGVWQMASVLSCALGMACKESMATAPLMVVAYDWIFVFDSLKDAVRSRWHLYAGLAMTWLGLAALMWSGPRVHSAGFSTNVRPWTYLLNQTVMITQYLHLAVWPRSLVLNYGLPLPLTLGDVMPYALLVGVLLLVTVAALFWRPKLGFLGAWVFVTLAPTSSIVPIATEVGAERRMYLPLAGLVVLAVVGVSLLWDHLRNVWPARTTLATARVASFSAVWVVALVSTVFAAGTVARNREYRSALALARTVLARRPSNMAHYMMGTALMEEGDHEGALRHLREAIRGNPRARYSLGLELFKEGKLDDAIRELDVFVREEPLLLEVVSARTLMGRALLTQQKWPGAVEQFRLVLMMTPLNVEAEGLLAEALFRQQAFDEASVHYRAYLRYRPNDPNTLANLGIALAAAGKSEEAISAFRRAVDLAPQDGAAERNLANALLDNRDFGGAAMHAQRAVTLRPDDPVVHDLLGLALVPQGKLDAAEAQFKRALEIDPADSEVRGHLAAVLQMRGSSARVPPRADGSSPHAGSGPP